MLSRLPSFFSSGFATRSRNRTAKVASVTILVFCHEYTDFLKFLAKRVSKVSDEVIFAVDDRVSSADLRRLRRLRARVILHQFEDCIENSFSIYREASKDFVVRFDSDEVPSEALHAEIGNLRERGSTCSGYLIPRAWVVDEGKSFVDSYPWFPDEQSRIIRTNTRLRKYPVTIHEPLLPEGRLSSLTGVVYHLDLALRPFTERKEKVERYRSLCEPLLPDGREVSSTYYLPELAPSLQLSLLEKKERKNVVRALRLSSNKRKFWRHAPMGWRRKSTKIEYHDKKAEWPKTLTRCHFNAEILELEKVVKDESFHILVTVLNTSDFSWPVYENGLGIALGARRKLETGPTIDIARAIFQNVVEPGSAASALLVLPIQELGPGVIEIGLVDEGREWLGSSMMNIVIMEA